MATAGRCSEPDRTGAPGGRRPSWTTARSHPADARAAQYDKSGEAHYNLISALHKSVRGSDPDAALYWFARMLEGGEDPRYLARRITRMAVEDIGLADPQAQRGLPRRLGDL
jgi:putative ATPase